MASGHNQENAVSRTRLRALVARRGDEQLAAQMDNDWTVAVCLAHLAFYDRRALESIRRYEQTGPYDTPFYYDVINKALLPLLRLIPARRRR